MINYKLTSPIKTVTSGNAPTVDNLAKGEIALYKPLNGVAKIYYNPNGKEIVSFAAEMADSVSDIEGGLLTSAQVAKALTELKEKFAGLWHMKGTKSTVAEIKALTSAEVGDVWHCKADGSEWVCTAPLPAGGSADCWEEIGTIVDLSDYPTRTEVNNGISYIKDYCFSNEEQITALNEWTGYDKELASTTNLLELIEINKDDIEGISQYTSAIIKTIGDENDASDKEGSLYARIAYATEYAVNAARQATVFSFDLLSALTTSSTASDIATALKPIGKSTSQYPVVGDIVQGTDKSGNTSVAGLVSNCKVVDVTTSSVTLNKVTTTTRQITWMNATKLFRLTLTDMSKVGGIESYDLSQSVTTVELTTTEI